MEGKFYVGSLEVHKISPPWELGVNVIWCSYILCPNNPLQTSIKLTSQALRVLVALLCSACEEELVVCFK